MTLPATLGCESPTQSPPAFHTPSDSMNVRASRKPRLKSSDDYWSSFVEELRSFCAISSRFSRLSGHEMRRGLAGLNDGLGYPIAEVLALMDDIERSFQSIKRELHD
jgi:hypothetical protein